MAQHKYKVGDVVEIFDDPITKQKFEGRVNIVGLRDVDNYYEIVFFEDEDYEGTYPRFVY